MVVVSVSQAKEQSISVKSSRHVYSKNTIIMIKLIYIRPCKFHFSLIIATDRF